MGQTVKNMANVFCITYGGCAKNGSEYIPYKAVVHSAEEAIAVINTWKSYGRKNSTDPTDRIVVNEVTEKKIRALFADGLGTYGSGEPRDYVGVSTKGCGAWEIGFTYAHADTLQEHERICNELHEAEEAARKEREREIKRQREMELNVRRRGWYYVEMDLELDVSPRHGNDYHANTTFCEYIIAESGADAYRKMVNEVGYNPLTYHGNDAVASYIPESWSSEFSFTFLGVKTDDGYSVEEWEKMKENNTDSALRDHNGGIVD